jgi:hypothetical protein
MRFISLLIATTALLPWICAGQDDTSNTADDNAIHAITELHEDGTKTVTITDPDKHTSEASTYNAGDRLIEKVVYTLDENNSPVSGLVYGADNAVAFKTTYKHDDFNRIVEEDDFTLQDELFRRFTYDFGPDGKLKQIHAFDGQGNELQESDAHKDQRQSLPRGH